MSQRSQNVKFQVMCPEAQAWLVLTSDHQEPVVVAMQQTGASHWSASADLPPGEYRCRYYGGNQRRVIYYGAAHIEGSIEHGMDTLLSIAMGDETKAAAFVP